MKRVSLCDENFQFNPHVYILLRRLDKETLTNVLLEKALVDLEELLSVLVSVEISPRGRRIRRDSFDGDFSESISGIDPCYQHGYLCMSIINLRDGLMVWFFCYD